LSKIGEGYLFTCSNCQKQIGIFEPAQVERYTKMLAANGGIVCNPEIDMLVRLTNTIQPQTVSGDIQQMTATYKAMPPLGKAIVIAFTVFMIGCLPIICLWAAPYYPIKSSTAVLTATRPRSTTGILFQDNFSNPKSGWTTRDDAKLVKAYVDGEFSINMKAPNLSSLSLNLTAGIFKAVHLEVMVRDVSKSVLAKPGFGLVCFLNDNQNYYGGGIAADGAYIIIQTTNGTTKILSGDGKGWSGSKDITKNAQSYRVGLDCDGKEAALYADGKLIAKATGEPITEGVVGLLVSNFDQGDAEVRFDDFVVTPLKP
jgi:hypothetical protein